MLLFNVELGYYFGKVYVKEGDFEFVLCYLNSSIDGFLNLGVLCD